MNRMRLARAVPMASLVVACGSSSGRALVTTQINPNLPSEETPYLPPDVPPWPVLPPHEVVDAGDAATD